MKRRWCSPSRRIGIDHHSQRAAAGHQPRGQLRIVDRHRARADHDGVAEGAQAVHVAEVLLAGHPARVAGVGRDEPVHALTEMSDRDRVRTGSAADRQVEIDHRARVGIRVEHRRRLPSAGCAPHEQRVGVVSANRSQLAVRIEREGRALCGVRELFGGGSRREQQRPHGVRVERGAAAARRARVDPLCHVPPIICAIQQSEGAAARSVRRDAQRLE